MADTKLQVFTYDNLALYDELLKGYVDTEDAKSLKTVAIDGNTLKFYRVSEPVGETVPAYTITLPETDLTGLIPKITGATAGNVVTAKADGTIEDSGIKAADLATKANVKTVQDAVDVLNGADTVEGSVAKSIKDLKSTLDTDIAAAKKAGDDAQADVDTLEAKVGDTSTLTTTEKSTIVGAVNELKGAIDDVQSAGEVTIDTSVTTEGMSKSYTFKQNGVTLGVVDVPRDMVVQSGVVEKDPEGQPAGTYLVLTLANATNDKVYVNVGTLVDIYTAEQSASQIQLTINPSTREISAVVVAGSITATELASNSVTTAKIADGNVTLAKLATDVTDSIADAKKAGTDASAAVTALEEGQVATNTTNIATLQSKVGEGFEQIPEASIRALFATT